MPATSENWDGFPFLSSFGGEGRGEEAVRCWDQTTRWCFELLANGFQQFLGGVGVCSNFKSAGWSSAIRMSMAGFSGNG
jgi:hypothetical protein